MTVAAVCLSVCLSVRPSVSLLILISHVFLCSAFTFTLTGILYDVRRRIYIPYRPDLRKLQSLLVLQIYRLLTKGSA